MPRSRALLVFTALLSWPAAAECEADTEDIAAIEQLAEETRNKASIPGLALGLIDRGVTVLAAGFGSADATGEVAITADTVFAIGSTTKAFTATLVGLLVDDGLLEWEVPVRSYLGGFTMKDPLAGERVTALDLLTHRTGLPRHNLLFSVTPFSRRELVAKLCCLDPSADFRAEFQYTNLGYVAIGHLVGELTRSTWEEALRTRLLAPLGLENTFLSASEAHRRARTADGHWLEGDRLVRAAAEPNTAIAPAGGLYSNLRDMLRWLRFHLEGGRVGGRQLLSEESVQRLHSPQIVVGDSPIRLLMTHPVAPHLTYGLGWYVQVYRGRVVLHHGGRRDGFSALVSMTPDSGRGLVLLANRQGVTGQLSTLAREIEDRLLGADDVDWEGERMSRLRQVAAGRRDGVTVTVAEQQPRRSLTEYTGTYEEPAYGRLRIEAATEEDGLRFTYYRLHGLALHVRDELFRSRGGDVTVSLTFLGREEGPPRAVAVPLEPAVEPIVFVRLPTDEKW